ncbi:hypothetical protein L861_14970 [Litchfieldella anticariensis FP35 = DSM 16096]|uniref:Polyketide cyclase n=1 Tax=Litchfieldella anticariensis (strain DSM 16096 / CECT 5854 / CIP 108499 / LMG 22089 / FP35) TaxID=1121939 RepID=S2LC75_LITA3|nr:hypothetical protein L861_14970 [Halomonas anticariensis FP35 = DSM 16096]
MKHTTVIAAAPDVVFAYVADLRNERRWQPDIKALIPVTEGTFSRGSRFIEVRHSFGIRFRWEFEITNLNPGKGIHVISHGGRCPYHGSRIFSAVPGGTCVIEQGELQLPGVPQCSSPLITWLSQRSIRNAYARLKTLLEGGSRLT